MGWLFNLLTPEQDTFSTQADAVRSLLEQAFKRRETVSLPTIKNYRYDGKNTIASHSKIISNLREEYRKQGKDILCYVLQHKNRSGFSDVHTRYELVEGVRPVTKIITTC